MGFRINFFRNKIKPPITGPGCGILVTTGQETRCIKLAEYPSFFFFSYNTFFSSSFTSSTLGVLDRWNSPYFSSDSLNKYFVFHIVQKKISKKTLEILWKYENLVKYVSPGKFCPPRVEFCFSSKAIKLNLGDKKWNQRRAWGWFSDCWSIIFVSLCQRLSEVANTLFIQFRPLVGSQLGLSDVCRCVSWPGIPCQFNNGRRSVPCRVANSIQLLRPTSDCAARIR